MMLQCEQREREWATEDSMKSNTAVYESFNEAFPEQSTTKASSASRGADAKRDRTFRDAYRRANKQGWENVTVVNLHPFRLDHNMGYLGHVTVEPKKQGEMYSLLVIDQPRFDAKDLGDANFEAILVTPKEIAEDLIKTYAETGGVFCYVGTGPVPEDLLDAAVERQLTWYWQLFQEGNANWSQFNKNPRHITDPMRHAAKELFRLKLVNIQPEWITITRNESPDSPCEGCGTIIPKVAKFCPHCSTIYDAEWVQARRPDLWRLQNPGLTPEMRAVAGAGGSSADSVDVDKLIEEENAGSAPVGKPNRPPKVK